jgi:AmmeMemoRadiSam system protein B
MSQIPDRPRLRPGLAAAPTPEGDGAYLLWDRQRITQRCARALRHEIEWAQLFDGRHTLAEVAELAARKGIAAPVGAFADLAARLDAALLLDSPALYAYLEGPVREPSCVGAYSGEPESLREQLAGLFAECGAPAGPPPAEDRGLRGVLVPHMDYARGGAVYGHGFKELFERTAARLFVIIGTSHYSPARVSLTRQHFLTPLGVAETDTAYVDRLVAEFGDGAFADPLAHFPEHSIELEVVMLQYLYEKKRDIRIVPIVVGSFHDAVAAGETPDTRADVARMVAAMRAAEAAAGEPVCYVISGDLAHIGPKFHDPEPVHSEQLAHSRSQDQALIAHAAKCDHDAYFRAIAAEQDARRICGLPPTWLTLAATEPSRGRLLRYEQYVEPTQGYESVSFASMAFDR